MHGSIANEGVTCFVARDDVLSTQCMQTKLSTGICWWEVLQGHRLCWALASCVLLLHLHSCVLYVSACMPVKLLKQQPDVMLHGLCKGLVAAKLVPCHACCDHALESILGHKVLPSNRPAGAQ